MIPRRHRALSAGTLAAPEATQPRSKYWRIQWSLGRDAARQDQSALRSEAAFAVTARRDFAWPDDVPGDSYLIELEAIARWLVVTARMRQDRKLFTARETT